jgi:hypothetical protein
MAIEKKTEFEIEHTFDPVKNRHFLNGDCTVLHCHHYSTLYVQLALDAKDFEGVRHLVENAEDVFYNVLNRYYQAKNITSIADKVAVAEEYWKISGMGIIKFSAIGKYAVTAEMEYSHLDEGWLKKWGSHDQPINFFTTGFVAAVADLTNNNPPRSFQAKEIKSLVCGDEKSVFKAVVR